MQRVGFPSAPTLLLKRYRTAIDQVAASLCTGVVRGGLLSYGITRSDAEYPVFLITYPLETAAQVVLHEDDPEYRPVPAMPVLLLDNGMLSLEDTQRSMQFSLATRQECKR